jgi:sugar/nucleoside kinase (ribokinase family)
MNNTLLENSYQFVNQVFIGRVTVDDIIVHNAQSMFLGKPGGAVMYSSAGAALWGDMTGIVANIGDSFNESLLSNLSEQQKLDVNGLHRKSGVGVKFWILYDEDNEHEFIVKRNSSALCSFDPVLADIPKGYIESSNIFHIAPFALESQAVIVEFLHKKGKLLTLDPDIESCDSSNLDKWHNVLSKVDVFLPSEMEFKKLIGEHDTLSIESYPGKMKNFAIVHNIKYTVLKLGINGVLLYDLSLDKCTKYIAANCSVIDCTGAGDSFAGGFCYKFKEDNNPYNAIPYGLITAAMKIEGTGSDFLLTRTRSEADIRLSNYISHNL